MTYKALYMPASEKPPRDKGGFLTEEDAWKWVEDNHLCSMCLEDLRGHRLGLPEDYDKGIFYSAHPACMCEWLVIDEKEELDEIS